MMTHLSLFTGIGGFALGFELAGIETVAMCECDKFCRRVLKTHWPEVLIHENIEELDGREYRDIGIISGWFPCQDLSVAGNRAGITGARSGLFFELVRVVAEAKPRYLVWENVPGLLSSNGGDDFRAVLAALAEIGYFGAWRVLDSQFFGVAQRRRRVFGVFAQGDSGWRRAGAILFEREGGGWHPEASRKTGEGVAHCLDSRTGGDSGKEQQRTFIADSEDTISERSHTVTPKWARRGWPAKQEYTGLIAWHENISGQLAGSGRARALRSGASHSYQFVCGLHANQRGELRTSGRAGSLTGSRSGKQFEGIVCPQVDADRVREAPGLPRGMDSARYRGLGNAVTVNVVYWIGQRIMQADEGSSEA